MSRPALSLLVALSSLVASACSGAAPKDAKASPPASGAADAAQSATSAPAASKPKAVDPRVTRADAARIKGSASARTWVIIVSDFQCPFCGQWEKETAAQLDKEFVLTGVARVAFVNYPLRQHANAFPAAEAAMCAGAQGRFWEMHDRLFATQEEWSKIAQPNAFFASLAKALGADAALFDQCVADGVMRPMIEADYERATTSGAGSTPTFLIGDAKLAGVQKIDAFRTAIAQASAARAK